MFNVYESIPGCTCVPFSYLGTRRVFIEIIGSSRKAFKVLERCVLVFGTIWEEGGGSKMQLLTEYWWIYIIYDLSRVEQSTAGQEFWQVQTHIYIIFTENKGFRRGFYHISIGLELSGTKVHGALTWAVSFWGVPLPCRLENMLKSQESVSLLLEHRAQLEALVGDTSNTGPIVDQYQIL